MSSRVATGVAALWLAATLVVAAGATPAAVHALAYPEGAPPGFSGGAGEQSCHACHFHAEPNTGAGRVSISGVPDRYVAGERYTIVVALTRPGMQLAGFQLAARATEAALSAGTLAPGPDESERIAIETQNAIHYANQRTKGVAVDAAGTARWTLVWTAPQNSAAVAFHVAANAADGDGTAEGDYVHTATVESSPK